MHAADIMTRSVITVAPSTPILEAITLMLEKRISGLPVVDAAGVLVGIVTEGDFLRRAETGTEKKRPRWLQFLRSTTQIADEYVRTHGRRVADVMTADVITVPETALLEDVVSGMERHHVRRLPVVDSTQHLVGVVSRTDLLRALIDSLPVAICPPADDAALRDHVMAELNRQQWASDGRVTVSVTSGTVTLGGIVFDLRERDALRVAAENIPGVQRVEDHLDFVDPAIGAVGVP